MIGSIHGILLNKTNSNAILIDCAGVGYEVMVAESVIKKLPPVGTHIFLFTYLRILEDAHTLYGFVHPMEKELFLEIIKINKIGPKIALAILDRYNFNEMVAIIKTKDHETLAKNVSGVGKVTAQRIILELFNQLDSLKRIALETGLTMENMKKVYPLINPKTATTVALTPFGNETIAVESLSKIKTKKENVTSIEEDKVVVDSWTPNFDSPYADFTGLSINETVDTAKIALVNLGLGENKAQEYIEQVYKEGMPTQDLVKACLDLYMGKK